MMMLEEFILESVFRFNIMVTNIFEDLTNSVISCFNKYFDFETRSSRKEFWYWQLFRILMFLSITFIESLGLSGILFISNFIFLIPEIAGVPIIVSSKSLKICFFHSSLPSLELILNKYPFVLNKYIYDSKYKGSGK